MLTLTEMRLGMDLGPPLRARAASTFTARVVPDGADVHVVPADQALAQLYGREVIPAQVRAEVVAHLRRYQDSWKTSMITYTLHGPA